MIGNFKSFHENGMYNMQEFQLLNHENSRGWQGALGCE